jgi:dihydropteroate synthase
VRLALRGSELELEPGRPALMGIVNATPDSFSDRPGAKRLDELVRHAETLVADGAAILDVGGQSGRTDRPPIGEDEEAERITGLVARLAGEGIAVSADTWRAGPARAALEAGAAMINDVSALADPMIASLCAEHEAALVITHTRLEPKVKGFPDYEDVVADVLALLNDRAAAACARGLDREALLLDPGLDLAKSPAESVAVLRRLAELEPLGRPLLLAVSRKDFLGAITGRAPRERGAATLAALEPALGCPAAVVRVHDVAAAADFLAVRATLRGNAVVDDAPLSEDLRREPAA